MNAKTRLTLGIILLSSTLTVMAGAIIGPVVNLIREGLGVDQSMAGLIVTAHGLCIAVFSPAWGYVIDKVGTKKPYIFGLLVYGLAGGSGLFISSYWPLIASRVVFGIGVAAVYTSVTVMILNLWEGEEKDKVMGWRGSSNSISAAVWPLAGGALGALSWHSPFGIYLVGVPLGVLALLFVPNSGSGEAFGGGASIWRVFRENNILVGIYGFMFLTNLFLYTNVVYLPTLLERRFGVENSFHISLFLAVMGLSAGVVAALYYKVKSRFEYEEIVPIALLLWIAAFSTAWMAPHIALLALSVVLYGAGQGLALPTAMVWVGDVVSKRFYGSFSSYLGTFGYLGQFAAPLVYAPVLPYLGIGNLFLTASGVSAVLLVVALAASRLP